MVLDPLDQQHLLPHAFFRLDQQRDVPVLLLSVPAYRWSLLQPVFDLNEVFLEAVRLLVLVVVDEYLRWAS
jgi:hypothetical protein